MLESNAQLWSVISIEGELLCPEGLHLAGLGSPCHLRRRLRRGVRQSHTPLKIPQSHLHLSRGAGASLFK